MTERVSTKVGKKEKSLTILHISNARSLRDRKEGKGKWEEFFPYYVQDLSDITRMIVKETIAKVWSQQGVAVENFLLDRKYKIIMEGCKHESYITKQSVDQLVNLCEGSGKGQTPRKLVAYFDSTVFENAKDIKTMKDEVIPKLAITFNNLCDRKKISSIVMHQNSGMGGHIDDSII